VNENYLEYSVMSVCLHLGWKKCQLKSEHIFCLGTVSGVSNVTSVSGWFILDCLFSFL
jgi:putative Mn2+ efflux pump MntP